MTETNFISLEVVFNKLGLSDMPFEHACEEIAGFVNSGKIYMYFDESVKGIYETETLGKGVFHSGRKRATQIDANTFDEEKVFLVHEYMFDNKHFFPTDASATKHTIKIISASRVYFDKDQVDVFAKTSGLKKAKGDQGLLKAVALLAREKAEESGIKYRSGNNVNASAFKEHILDLAKRYEISDGYLKSLDDKINTALVEFDLKEIQSAPKKKNPN